MTKKDTSIGNSAKNLTNKGLTEMRRKDRQVTDEAWMKALLHRGAFGTLGTCRDGQPFLNTNNYVYDEPGHAIYFHRAKTGRTSENLAHNPRVCYTVSEMGRILPSDKAIDFGVEFRSVVIFGTAELVEDEGEKARVLQMLLSKHAPHLKPGTDYRPPQPDEIKRTAVYKIPIEQWSGKQEEKGDD